MWSPAGNQAVDRVVWTISALGLGWLPIPRFWSVHWGSQPLIRLRTTRGFRCRHPAGVLGVGPRPLIGVHAHWGTLGLAARQPGRLSGRVPTQGFRCGPQVTDWGTRPLGHFGSGAQAAGPLIRARTHPEFQLWVSSLLIWVCASWASGERWGCFSGVHSPGAEGGGVPEAAAAAESSLSSC